MNKISTLFLVSSLAYLTQARYDRKNRDKKKGEVGDYDFSIFTAEVPGSVCL